MFCSLFAAVAVAWSKIDGRHPSQLESLTSRPLDKLNSTIGKFMFKQQVIKPCDQLEKQWNTFQWIISNGIKQAKSQIAERAKTSSE